MRSLLTITFVWLAACHDHDEFADFQACFDEHHDVEGYNPTRSITICALDHDIAGTKLSFATSAECVAYMAANLAAASATVAEVQAGCDDYITQKGR